MTIDKITLILIWSATIILLIACIPKDKVRDAHVIFLFKQVLTWLIGLLVVEKGLIEYPNREFPHASGTSFSFEYFIFPAICVVFNLRYPEGKSTLFKICWWLFFPSWMTASEVILETYTDLIRYKNWTWYYTWISLLVTFYISRRYYKWFTKKPLPEN
ncbi:MULTISPECIES: CBO0543 family protein [Paenibacillus]|uniref:CBO0543 family protein n=1 Tax=Paenibacillus TaxID=44249 RepID=UPI0022B87D20|nr:CBO0543 family protein [Paenibacillus caseinilyticus]MCZ8518377.1 hypothetical protein [Paenibacillus caseinilyticus]